MCELSGERAQGGDREPVRGGRGKLGAEWWCRGRGCAKRKRRLSEAGRVKQLRASRKRENQRLGHTQIVETINGLRSFMVRGDWGRDNYEL